MTSNRTTMGKPCPVTSLIIFYVMAHSLIVHFLEHFFLKFHFAADYVFQPDEGIVSCRFFFRQDGCGRKLLDPEMDG